MDARTKILEAADDIFGGVGFDASTTREIAELAGVNKALIHYHFGSKDGLLAVLLDQHYDALSMTLQSSLMGASDLQGGFRDLIDVYVDFLVENRNFTKIVQREATGGKHMEQIQARMLPLFQLGISALEARYPAAAGGGLDASQLLISFYGMISSSFTYSGLLEHLMEADPLAPKQVELRKKHLHMMLDMILKTLDGDSP